MPGKNSQNDNPKKKPTSKPQVIFDDTPNPETEKRAREIVKENLARLAREKPENK